MENFDQKISEVSKVDPHLIDASLFYPLGKKKAQLLSSTNEPLSYHLKDDECALKLRQPIYIASVKIYGEDVEAKLKLHVIDINGNKISVENSSTDDEFIEFSVNNIANEIILTPIKGFFKGSSVKLTKLSLTGFTLDQADEIADSYSSYLSIRDEMLTEFKTQLEGVNQEKLALEQEKNLVSQTLTLLNEDISNKKSEKLQLEERISELELEATDKEASIQIIDEDIKKKSGTILGLKAREDELNSKNKTIEDAIEQNKRKNSTLNNEIADNERKLKELISNKNLFSEELATYNEASENDETYHTRWAVGAGILLGLIAAACFVSLLLLAYNGQGSWEDIWLTRAPLSIFTIFLIKSLYSFMRSRLDKVTEIKDRKKNLIAIGIIAKDVTESISEDLGLTNEEKFKFKFNEKIDMVKSLLLSVSGTDSNYKSHKLKSLLTSINNKKLQPETTSIIHDSHQDGDSDKQRQLN